MAEKITCTSKGSLTNSKINIYACLWMMINEQDVDKFKENESLFIDYWSSRQKKFIKYYQNEYKTKAGT